MEAFEIARENMVKGQISPNGVYNKALTDVILRVPKHIFIPEERQGIAYIDGSIDVGQGRYILPMMIFAKMLEALDIKGVESVLDVACGTGYSSAILANLCKKVVAVESESELASKAHMNLNKIGADNVIIMVNPLADGHETSAPYDIIVVNGAVKEVSQKLFDQLGNGGKMVVVVQDAWNSGKIVLYKKVDGTISCEDIFDVNMDVIVDF